MKARFLVALVAAAAAAFVAAGSAGAAGDSTCPNGVLAPGVYGNVTVNSYCTATGSFVIRGNLVVNGGGVFDAESGLSIITGSVQAWPGSVVVLIDVGIFRSVSAQSPKSFILVGSGPHQGVLISGGGGPAVGACNRTDVPITHVPEVVIAENEIVGNVSIGGRGGCANVIGGNEITGNVSFVNNTADANAGANVIASNLIGGNLFCKGNTPGPIIDGGGLNSVGGSVNFPGQCVDLVP